MADPRTETQIYTVRMELVDQPGELVRALTPIADNDGNLLSIHHERGNVTPSGRIPVEIGLEAHPDRFETIVTDLRGANIDVVRAGEERYSERLTVVLSGDLLAAGLSEVVTEIEQATEAAVTDISLAAPSAQDATASTRLQIATNEQYPERILSVVRTIAADRELTLIEPQHAPEEAE